MGQTRTVEASNERAGDPAARRDEDACRGPAGDLAGHRAVVTAAAGGVGKALVTRLLAAGVAVTAVDPDADRLRAEFGGTCALVVGDLARGGATLAGEVLAAQGPVDLIVCNFGPGDRTGVLDLDEPGFDAAFGVRGPLFFVQRLVRGLLTAGRSRGDRRFGRPAERPVGRAGDPGRWRSTGSVLFLADAGDVPAWGAWGPRSEQACAELTAMLAAPLDPHGIRVNAIAPGWGGRSSQPGTPAGGRLGLPGQPEDVANLATCLLSEGCTGSTGGRFSLTRRPAHWTPVGRLA